ncbi:unnamed protein product [Rotaria sordida]|uniref:Ig-like domain-containing protein n=1 Tax=Rotaria sordida TaxID=392033 RepID=A0A819MFL3_9BILA|nr:unnamed protein product [Rotaria sordida]CAF3979770.1 unnamed protein product [Rotaria sordida]
MYSYEHIPVEWFTSNRRPQTSNYPPPPPMSRPVSKSFNRISDFIFPDTVHVRFRSSSRQQQQQQQQRLIFPRYQRTENYSLPALNQRDLIIVERLPVEELDDVDLLYREQYYEPNQQIQRCYTSTIDQRRLPSYEKISTGLKNRSVAYREKFRDRKKRHTTDNAYHSMLKSILEKDQQPYMNDKNSNYILSYRTTLDPITDSESMTSINQQKQYNNDTSNYRVPINGTIPNANEKIRSRQFSSTISTRDSSSDTDITERRPKIMNSTYYQQDSSYINSSNIPSNISPRFSSNRVHVQYQPDRFIPINSSIADTNNHETMSNSNNLITSSPFNNVTNDQINNQISSQDSTHHVSLCVNDLHTTLFIDEDTLKKTKTSINNNGRKAVIKTFIDRIIKRLQHFKSSLDNGLIHTRKRNTLVNGSIITADYHSPQEITNRKTNINQSIDFLDENKLVRPYFLIKPQTILMLPNETAKFKCCFGGDPFPTLTWSHNECRIPEIFLTSDTTSSRYRTHKLHDIYYLDIGPINLRDHGQIKCTIMNRFGREEAVAQLIVVPSPADATPYITQPLNDIIIIEGRPLKISCGITGLQVTVNWFHNGKLISSMTESKDNYNNEKSIFSLSCCLKTDTGTIDCFVKNRFGEARTSCRITVINEPELDR